MNLSDADLSSRPHRRKNILTDESVLVSPHRTLRPWQGEVAELPQGKRPSYDPKCYLCPGNKRANGEMNPRYTGTYVFTNDFPALLEDTPQDMTKRNALLVAKGERGMCRVVNFSPRHDLTLAEMPVGDIMSVIRTWQDEYGKLGSDAGINYVQIFENKGALMGNSNPHPHCQIWAQSSIPNEPAKEFRQFKKYYAGKKKSLLGDYLKLELKLKERLVYENSSFVVLVPYWAVWPYETMIVSKRKIPDLLRLTDAEVQEFAEAMSVVTIKYDNLFKSSFPYSAGLHQAPTDGKVHPEWHFHMHFLPPLLRSASVRKFMVGYEMLAEPQRDVTPEFSAGVLRELPAERWDS